VVPWLTGHSVNRGVSTACALDVTVAFTCRARVVLQTQTETLILPPGDVSDSCRRIWAVTQRMPGRCDLVGDGLGEGECVRECDGDGDGDSDGLGLLLAEGLGLWLALALVVGAVVEVFDGLGDELEPDVELGEGLADGDVVTFPPSKTADATAGVPPPQGELIGCADAANAGAMATPDAIKDPAAAQTTARPALMTPARTTTLRSSSPPVLPQLP
jgi:hypothetical protein